VDQRAQDERVVEARPGPGAFPGDVVDGDEGELVTRAGGIGVERLAPVEQRLLEGVERARELGQQGEDAPEQGEAGGEGDAAFLVRIGRRGRGSRGGRGGDAEGKFFHVPFLLEQGAARRQRVIADYLARTEPSWPSSMSMKVVEKAMSLRSGIMV